MTQENNKKFTPPHPLNTAVLFLVFNRLDTTKQVFASIRQAKPPRLYVAADGARETKDGEEQKVKAVRDYVMSNIDWECEVKTLFRESNFGCKMAVSGSIDWFFENEEMGIILEDDCLPSQSFFWFCEELLERYKDDYKISLITGDGRGTKDLQIESDYDFNQYPLIWGWASWKRTWDKYDILMSDWPENKIKVIEKISSLKGTRKYWTNAFENTYNSKINTWDYQLAYSILSNSGLCIVPKVNLIKNIGFGEDATHTFDPNSNDANIAHYELNFPLKLKNTVSVNQKISSKLDRVVFYTPNLLQRVYNKIKIGLLHMFNGSKNS